jgi:hypothetical protein
MDETTTALFDLDGYLVLDWQRIGVTGRRRLTPSGC